MQRSGREGAVVGFAERGQAETDGNRTRDAQEQRSGRWMAMVGVAARKQAEMGLWVQRSGWERAVVGVAAWEGLPCKAKVRSLDWGFGPLCLSCRMVFLAGWFFLYSGCCAGSLLLPIS